MPPSTVRPPPARLTTVFSGSMTEVLVCQGLLESNGVPTHILDHNLKGAVPVACACAGAAGPRSTAAVAAVSATHAGALLTSRFLGTI